MTMRNTLSKYALPAIVAVLSMMTLGNAWSADLPPAPVGPYWSIEDEKAGLLPTQPDITSTTVLPPLENSAWQWGAPELGSILEPQAGQHGTDPLEQPVLQQSWLPQTPIPVTRAPDGSGFHQTPQHSQPNP